MITREMQIEAALKNLVALLDRGLPATDIRICEARAEARLILSLKKRDDDARDAAGERKESK